MSTSADVLSSIANPAAASQTAQGSASVLSQVASASENQDAPVKMVSPKGEVVYARGDDNVANLQKSGHTRIESDGSFHLQGIRGEDPLEEAKRYQRVRAALTPQEKSGANKAEMIEGATTGVKAGLDTALGVTGASGAGAALGVGGEVASPAALGVTRVIGKAAGTALRIASTPVGKLLLKSALEAAGAGVGTALAIKWAKL